MKCQNCGYEVNKDMTTCPSCGTVLPIRNGSNERKKTMLIVIISLVLLSSLFFLVVSLINGSRNEDGDSRDIETVNNDVTEEKNGTTTKKTTTAKESQTSNSTSKLESIQINGDNYKAPLGFEFRLKEDEANTSYLVREQSDALIKIEIIKDDTTLETILNNVLNDNQSRKIKISSDNIIYNYGNYNYYKIIEEEEVDRKTTRVHENVVLKLDDGVYVNAMFYDVENFGEQNYFAILDKFIRSKNA